jgi:hypothetical protein
MLMLAEEGGGLDILPMLARREGGYSAHIGGGRMDILPMLAGREG